MASRLDFIQYACDQLGGAGHITFRRMFGEAAVYCDGKVVALICDDQLFVKPTEAGRALIGRPVEAAPFPGARPHFLIDEGLDDREWLATLVRATCDALPEPKAKRPRASRARR
ncbi:MAG: TfoX/Sxy family protein [Polyangiaceae bacterium]|nr:TfoX/Sxy family protein [Polyangiaceae bacterium]